MTLPLACATGHCRWPVLLWADWPRWWPSCSRFHRAVADITGSVTWITVKCVLLHLIRSIVRCDCFFVLPFIGLRQTTPDLHVAARCIALHGRPCPYWFKNRELTQPSSRIFSRGCLHLGLQPSLEAGGILTLKVWRKPKIALRQTLRKCCYSQE